jgi:hypothetical protein
MNKWDVDAARVGSSHQGPRTAEHVCGRLIRNFPNRPWSEWERRIGIAWCARRRKYWPFAVRSWRETVETDPVLLRYARCVAIPTTRRQSSAVHKGERQRVSTAETLPENCNHRAHEESSPLAFADQPLRVGRDNNLAPDLQPAL